MLDLIAKLPKYYIAAPRTLPLNYTLSLTYRCNERCKTCRIYERDSSNELTLKEWTKIFEGLGNSPYWVTLSGGEPFLREDLIEICDSLCSRCKPTIVNIPTNGLLTERIVDWVWEMCMRHQNTELVINMSIDSNDPGQNDEIRGVKGAFAKSAETVKALGTLDLDNLTVGIHTVISKFNVEEFPSICDGLMQLTPCQGHYITEIAEERNELGTVGLPITPNYGEYEMAISYLLDSMKGKSIINAFRRQYYGYTLGWIDGNKGLPCCAGRASCQIAPDGDVWFCCIMAESIGDLRDANYDLARLWHNGKAEFLRTLIKENHCSCPMANVSYTNMLLNPLALLKVARNLI